jgi:hypothetical protein
MIKEFLKKTFIRKLWDRYLGLKNWYIQKFVILSYDEKRSILLSYKKKYGLDYFVETGTFFGDTVEFFRNKFKKVYSIELSEELALKCSKRFENISNVKIIQGDSGEILNDIIKEISSPILFWLDGHYSSEFYVGDQYIRTAKGEKETPILEELSTILSRQNKKHVILIDDARCFNGQNDYPEYSYLKKYILKLNPSAKIEKKRDIIRIT